mgnify:CR=1 FL=1
MVYLDGDIDENDEINLNDLVYLEAYSFGTEGYEINEDKIYNTAIKNENAPKALINDAINCMSTLNAFAGGLMYKSSVHAATDITGFGLLGHLNEMCKASQLSAEINFDVIPFIDGVESLAKSENISSGSKRNLDHANDFTYFDSRISEVQKLMISDAQTSGGILVALPEKAADEFAKRNVNIMKNETSR